MTYAYSGKKGVLAYHPIRSMYATQQGQIMKLSDIFDGHPLNLFPRVREDDPITSYEAADKVDFAGQHYDIILGCLTKHGPLGKDGIANRTNLEGNQIARRLSEMQKLHFIEPTGQTVTSNAGRSEREWRFKAT